MKGFLVGLVITLSFATRSEAQQITLNLDNISEKRIGTGHYLAGSQDALDTQLEFRVGGVATPNIHYVGHWQITEAMDDLGNNLNDIGGPPDGSDWAWTTFTPHQPTIHCTLSGTKRRATHLAHVHGECDFLVGGRAQTITIPHLKSWIGKTLNHPVLQAAGLKITVLPPAKPHKGLAPATNSVRLIIKGDQTHLDSSIAYGGIEIINAAGQWLMQGARFSDGEFTLIRPPDDTMTLRFHVLLGMQKVTIPIDLHDVVLP